jgi:riboflavin kinase/FMN adenylyltransferase
LRIVETPEVDISEQPVVAAIGAFDGVHLGHIQLFETALEVKSRTGLPVMAVGFHPHPKSLVKSGDDYDALLTPLEEKQALLADLGLDYFWAIPFTREMAQLSPRDFAHTYLRRMIRAQHIVCGFNFTFGHKRQGNPQVLRELGHEMGFEVSVVPPYTIEGEVVSSTKIRRLLSQGDVEGASLLLGRPYCIYGPATEGTDVYRRIGMPTCKVDFPADKFLPKAGVYAAWARAWAGAPRDAAGCKGAALCRDLYPGVASLATTRGCWKSSDSRETGESTVSLEVHLPEFGAWACSQGIPDMGALQSMQLFFVKHIREERRCEGKQHLETKERLEEHQEERMKADIQAALAALAPRDTGCRDGGLFTRISAYDRILNAD